MILPLACSDVLWSAYESRVVLYRFLNDALSLLIRCKTNQILGFYFTGRSGPWADILLPALQVKVSFLILLRLTAIKKGQKSKYIIFIICSVL